MKYNEYIKQNKDIIGMIHLPAMPGTPNNNLTPKEIIDKALSEAQTYKECGLSTVMIENMHDVPYTKIIGPEIVSLMSIIAYEIKKIGLYCGIQILCAANKEALAIAYAANLDFIRAEGFVYAHVADEGYLESCAGELLRYRKQINANNVLIFTDIKKKHSSHSITDDINIQETARTAEFFLSDGNIITGNSTGEEANIEELSKIQISNIPIIIGSGITAENINKYKDMANIFIVGSYFKKENKWQNELEPFYIRKLMKKINIQ